MTTCGPSRQNDSWQMELALTQSAGGSRAKTYRLLGAALVSKGNGRGSGRKSLDLLANYNRESSSWRTSQICLQETGDLGLAEFSETWPRSGMMRSGTAYRLPLSELHTVETGCGLWPTPNKSNGFAPFSMLTMQRKKLGLNRPSGCKMGFDLKWEERAIPYLVDGWINPILSEWLMGFPIGHTDLQLSGTP